MSKTRCLWLNLANPLYVSYHDKEWGRPIKNDRALFELLTLEGAQAGLSWETVLKKREAYKKAFFNFELKKVSKMSDSLLEKCLKNPDLIRNRLKIFSVPKNAQAFIQIQNEFGSFANYLWAHVDHKPIINQFKSAKDYPSTTPLSDKISKDLKKRGFTFVGSTIIYAFLQATGVVQDHSVNCYLHGKRLKSKISL